MKKKITVTLDPELLRAVRVWSARTGRSDSEIMREALRSYLGLDVIESVWARSDIPEAEALELAYDELRKSRNPTE